MSAESKKPRKAPVKKDPAVTAEKKVKAPRSKAAKTTVAEVTVVASNVKQWPSHEEIARLAHFYYVERGWQDGFHEQDWFRAEQDLLAS